MDKLNYFTKIFPKKRKHLLRRDPKFGHFAKKPLDLRHLMVYVRIPPVSNKKTSFKFKSIRAYITTKLLCFFPSLSVLYCANQ